MSVDLEDDHGFGDPCVKERADALNLSAKRTVDEADPLERGTERRDPVLTSRLGGFPIVGEGNVEYSAGVAEIGTQAVVLAPSG